MTSRVRQTSGLGLAVLLAVLVGVSSCDKKSEDGSTDEARPETSQATTAQTADATGQGAPRSLFETRHQRAEELMDRAVEAVREHFASAADPEEATFPGGTGVEWASAEAPPEEGATYQFGEAGRGDAESGDAIAEVLGLEPGDELPVRIVYRTGDGTGSDATAAIRAIADFDPSSEADHTLVQELSVDPKTGDVNVFPRLTRNRWK